MEVVRVINVVKSLACCSVPVSLPCDGGMKQHGVYLPAACFLLPAGLATCHVVRIHKAAAQPVAKRAEHA